MTDIIAFKCPHCGGNASKKEMRCNYCGAELIIANVTNSQESFKTGILKPYPHCNMEIKDAVAIYDELNKETAHSQKLMKKDFLEEMPTYRSNGSFLCGTGGLDSDEKLQYFLPFNGEPMPDWLERDKKKNFYAVTNKRLMVLYSNKYPKYLEITINSIASLSPLIEDQSVKKLFNNKDTYSFNVFTNDGKTQRIDGMGNEPRYCAIFWCYLANAIARQNQ